jgi:hypothetical protein
VPAARRRAVIGSSHNTAMSGDPSTINGAATRMSNSCCTMCAENDASLNP